MASLNESTERLIRLEQKHCAGSAWKDGPRADPDRRLHFLQMQAYDFDSSEKLLRRSHRAHPLLRIRGLLSSGRSSDAATLATKLGAVQEPVFSSELAVEKARIAGLEGNWSECARLAGIALTALPAPLSRLTLHQIRALSLLELGRLPEALTDLDEAETLAEVFPDSQSGFYTKVLRLRVRASQGRPENPWALAPGAELNPDQLLTLLRAETDLRRREGKDIRSHLLACLKLSETIGDHLYSALTRVEIAAIAAPDLELENADAFPRARKLATEIALGEGSANTLLIAAHARTSPKLDRKLFEKAAGSPSIAIPHAGWLAQLKPWSCTRLRGQSARLLAAIGNEAVGKRELFHVLWGKQKFSSRLHDPLIWNSLHRLNKQTRAGAQVTNAGVNLGSCWVVGQ